MCSSQLPVSRFSKLTIVCRQRLSAALGGIVNASVCRAAVPLLVLLALCACRSEVDVPIDYVPTEVIVDADTITRGDPMEVIDPVWWAASIYDGEQEYERTLAPFTRPQRLVWAVLWYDAEVNNGGHSQFFSNSTGIVWRDALQGLQEIGADEAADILQEAANRLEGNPHMDREQRNIQMEQTAAAFDDLDDRYYSPTGGEKASSLLMPYIEANAQQFYFNGQVLKPPLRPDSH